MPLVRAQAVLPFFTNLPTDVITNTFYFAADESLSYPAAIIAINPLIQQFYQDVYAVTTPPANYINQLTCHVNYYNMADPEPRVPTTMAFDPSASASVASNIPTEVAFCLSFEALPLSGMSQARRRGRIFLGGLVDAWMQSSTTALYPRFTTAQLTKVALAANNLREDANTALVPWCVWSTTEQQAFSIARGWVDNSPDNQRRRSVSPDARTLWP